MAATVLAYQTSRPQPLQTSDDLELQSANVERSIQTSLPQPAVTNVTLDAQLFPKERRLVVDGRYDIQNKTDRPISEIHLRKGDPNVEWLKLDVSGARLASDDEDFGYRIYRFAQPLAPGAKSAVTFRSLIWHRGFRAGGPATDIVQNGTFINNSAFAPIIGMDRNSVLQDRTQRRRHGLKPELRPAKLEDMSATAKNYVGADWVMSDIRVTTDAGQTPVAPGKKVADTTANGRRTARFVSESPILHFFSIQSGRL